MGGYRQKHRVLPLDAPPYTPDMVNSFGSFLNWQYRNVLGTVVRPSWSNGEPIVQEQHTTSYTEDWTARDETVSDLLDGRNKIQTLTPFDNGHEFRTEKFEFKYRTHHEAYLLGRSNTYYRGPLVVLPWGSPSAGAPLSRGLVDGRSLVGSIDRSKGTTLMNMARPTRSVGNLSQALGELVFDLPRLPFAAIAQTTLISRKGDAIAKAVGSEYLNQVFAWAPLVSDVLKICDAIVRSEAIIAQYLRDAGPEKAVRRRRFLPRTTETVSFQKNPNNGGVWPISGSGDMQSTLFRTSAGYKQPISITRNRTTEYWFSGAFSYFLNQDSSWVGDISRAGELARQVLGIGLTPELLWELAPWSWLSDWFVNMGDIISLNGDISQDRLLLRYGYLMRRERVVYEATHPGLETYYGYKTGPVNTVVAYESKERVRATPFDFGAKTGLFTESQFAILAALGMTRSPSRAAWG